MSEYDIDRDALQAWYEGLPSEEQETLRVEWEERVNTLLNPLINPLLGTVVGRVYVDGLRAGLAPEEAAEYADIVATYVALAVSNFTNRSSSLVTWESGHGKPRYTFSRQALQMAWDYAEVNPFGPLGIMRCVDQIVDVLKRLPEDALPGTATMTDVARGPL